MKPRRYFMPRLEWDNLSVAAQSMVRECRTGSLRVDRIAATRALADHKARTVRLASQLTKQFSN